MVSRMVDEETETRVFDKQDDIEINGANSDLKPMVTLREKLIQILHSHKFQLCIIGLVICDCLLVIVELLIEVHPSESAHDRGFEHHIPHYLSIAILSIFLVEILVKIYAFRLTFLQHKLELFDAVVVILSFALDIAFIDSSTAANASGLIILLRLWRVARILNGVVLSVKTQAEHKLAKERRLREALEQEVFHLKDNCIRLEEENETLRKMLSDHNIKVAGRDEATSIDKDIK